MRKIVLVTIIAFICIAGWLIFLKFQQPATQPVFVGESTRLRQTEVLLTLDSESSANCNIIWCASFPLAWQQLQFLASKTPLQIAEKPELSRRLNAAAVVKYDLLARYYYAKAGKIEDGIIPTIQQDMNERFPTEESSWLPSTTYGKGIIAYSYLATQVKFETPFLQIPDGVTFIDSLSHKTAVRAFGIPSGYNNKLGKLRKNTRILFYSKKESMPKKKWGNTPQYDFAVDLNNSSQPYQIILASVPPKATLAETIAEVKNRITKESQRNMSPTFMGPTDTLYVPETCWQITHHFAELEGEKISYFNQPIVEAKQIIDFTLDRNGVQLTSASYVSIQSTPKQLTFTGPFLLYLTRRGTNNPFFAMWVDNAELLKRL